MERGLARGAGGAGPAHGGRGGRGGVQLLDAHPAAGGVARNFAGWPKPRLGDRRLRAGRGGVADAFRRDPRQCRRVAPSRAIGHNHRLPGPDGARRRQCGLQPAVGRNPHPGRDGPRFVCDVLRSLWRGPRQPGLGQRTGGAPCGHSAGAVSHVAGLSIRAAGRLHPFPRQCVAGRRPDGAGDRRRVSPVAGRTDCRSAARGGVADRGGPDSGALCLAAQSRAGVADGRGVSPERRGGPGWQHQGLPTVRR